jgi:hypothetical protein
MTDTNTEDEDDIEDDENVLLWLRYSGNWYNIDKYNLFESMISPFISLFL